MSLRVSDKERFIQKVVRARFTFSSGRVLKERIGVGTCFVIAIKVTNADKSWVPKHYLVTNRHNVDYFLLNRKNNEGSFRLISIVIENRSRQDGQGPAVDSLEILPHAKILVDDNPENDVALIEFLYDFQYDGRALMLSGGMYLEHIYDETQMNKLDLGDSVSFMGFPGKLWDKRNHLPIVRQAVVSSVPNLDYSSDGQLDANRVLVAGLSFNGSSGSPVFQDRTGKLVGVMAGHYCVEDTRGVINWYDEPFDTFNLDSAKLSGRNGPHAGLSYFIKSSVIHRILNQSSSIDWGPACWDQDAEIWKPIDV